MTLFTFFFLATEFSDLCPSLLARKYWIFHWIMLGISSCYALRFKSTLS